MPTLMMTLHLLWVPQELQGTQAAFQVVALDAPVVAGQCTLLDVWHRHTPQQAVTDTDLVLLEDAAPAKLPNTTEFILLLTHDNFEPQAQRSHFYDWCALSQGDAAKFCRQECGQPLENLVPAARTLVGLPTVAAPH